MQDQWLWTIYMLSASYCGIIICVQARLCYTKDNLVLIHRTEVDKRHLGPLNYKKHRE